MDDFLKIARELGLPGVALIGGLYLLKIITEKMCDGIAWLGPNFFVPIRDGLISNISVLTAVISEIRIAVPVLTLGQEKVMMSAERVEDRISEIARDQRKIKDMEIALSRVMARKCPVDECPLIRSTADSDDFGTMKERDRQ